MVTQPPSTEGDAKLSIIASAGALARHFQPIATTTPQTWWDVGTKALPFDLTLTFSLTPQGGYAWQLSAYYSDGQGTTPLCDMDNPGNATVMPTWGINAGPYLATLDYVLRRYSLEAQRAGAAAFLAQRQGKAAA